MQKNKKLLILSHNRIIIAIRDAKKSKTKKVLASLGIALGAIGTLVWGVGKLRNRNPNRARVEDPSRRVHRAQERLDRITGNQQQSAEFNQQVGEVAEKQRNAYERTEDTLG